MCTYFECLPPKRSAFTPLCKKAGIHVDPGLFGYYPLVDRAHGTYMQVVSMMFPKSQTDFYLPTMLSMTLRLLVKHSVDRALRRQGGAGRARLHAEHKVLSWQAIWDATMDVLNSSDIAGVHKTPADVWRALGVQTRMEDVAVL